MRSKEDVMGILRGVQAGNIGLDDAAARLTNPLFCKVSAKKAVSVYGLRRWPVTLYLAEWERLLGFAPEVQRFIGEHREDLAEKRA